MDNEDYIIRMKELDQQPDPDHKEKRISKIRSFLGRNMEKPLMIDFSQDGRSSFTKHPVYQRPGKKNNQD